MILPVLLLATLGVADPQGAGNAAEARPAAEAGVDQTAAAAKKYCIVDSPTGSRLTKKSCRTRDEWMKRGVDPLAPQ